jgi:uncharacterized protein (TIGR02598 family)
MDTSKISGRKPCLRRGLFVGSSAVQRDGFSLVEVVLAVGIVAFAFVGVLALLPTGMSVFHQSLNISVGSQIAQRVINDAQQTDFTQLISGGAGTSPFRLANPIDSAKGPVRWFDDEGKELSSAAGAVYFVNTRIVTSTALPLASGTMTNPDLATVTVQVATNPGNQTLALSASTDLWSGAYQGNSAVVVPILTVSALIGKSQ